MEVTANMPGGGLSLEVSLGPSVIALRDFFMVDCEALGRLDLRRTSLQSIGDGFLGRCMNLTAVTFPPSLTELRSCFLAECNSLQRLDMEHTSLLTVGGVFALNCHSLTTVVLPDTVIDISSGFLEQCGQVEVTSGSTAVQVAAAEHNKQAHLLAQLNR